MPKLATRITIIVLTANALLFVEPAAAIDYPYCATGMSESGSQGCSYETLEQCREFVSGAGGYCATNPKLVTCVRGFCTLDPRLTSHADTRRPHGGPPR